MIDLVASLSLWALGALVALAYGVRALLVGAVNYARVDRDGGSALLPTSSMRVGYWALQPIGSLLVRARVAPDTVTLASLALGLCAAVAAATGHFGVAAALLTVSSLGDALDGMVARATGVASRAGEVLDAAADRYQEFAFLAGVAFWLRGDARLLGLTLLALLAAVMVSYATAKAEALQLEVPRGAMRRPERAAYLTLGAALTPLAALLAARFHAPWVERAPLVAALALVAVVGNLSAVRRIGALMRAAQIADATPFTQPQTRAVLALIGRHQASSVVTTAVDFGVMIACVSGLGLGPVAGTACGATAGAVTNFTLGRRWIFEARDDAWGPQALRYAAVSATSLGLNAAGEYLVAVRLGVAYVAARAITAIVVSLLWNLPMQRRFVFPLAPESTP